jgi:hypothetical protein
MQGLQPTIHHFREAGIIGYIDYIYTAGSQLGCRSSCGQDCNIKLLKTSRKLDKPFLVRDAYQCSLDGIHMHLVV